jgi:hypothetical protein
MKTKHFSILAPFFVGDQAIFRLELNNREGNDLKHKGKYRESLFVLYLTRFVSNIFTSYFFVSNEHKNSYHIINFQSLDRSCLQNIQ